MKVIGAVHVYCLFAAGDGKMSLIEHLPVYVLLKCRWLAVRISALGGPVRRLLGPQDFETIRKAWAASVHV